MNARVRVGRICAAMLALGVCGSAATVASPVSRHTADPWPRTPAVSDRVLLGLLSTTADTDLVSPAGIDAVLCALVPVMSERARQQRRAASESECRPKPDYVVRSIWFSRRLPVDTRGVSSLRPHAELYFEPDTVNAGVRRWLREHHALSLPLRRPLTFAAVSALDYDRAWAIPFYHIVAQPLVFHGRKRDARVGFLDGRQLASIDDRSCIRGVIPLQTGGAVFVTEIGSKPVAAAIRCLSRELDFKTLVNAQFYIPKLTLRRTDSIRERLRRLGLSDVFDGGTNPFPKLGRLHRVDEAIQAAELKMDWRGIHIRATTSFDTTLGVPPLATVLNYNHPFALRAVDEHGATVAVAVVNDL